MYYLIIITLHLGAFLVPFSDRNYYREKPAQPLPAWPLEFDGKPLTSLPITDLERGFSRGFPGRTGRFSDGTREIIFRYVNHPTWKLHPSADCLRGSGFQVKPEPIYRDPQEHLWGCVKAQRDEQIIRVCESIYDPSGKSWHDVSSWFWSVILSDDQGPWKAVTIAERINE